MPESIKDDEIVKIAEITSGDVYYENSALTDKIPQNVDSKDLTDYTKTVIVTLADESNYTITAISYTKVLTTSSDFTVFKGAKNEVINGYYIMANDIELDNSWNGNASGANGATKATFKGVFDGKGHTAEIAVKLYGLFGNVDNAIIKDVAFVVKEVGPRDFAYTTILANKISKSTISDCYFAYDLPEDTIIDVAYYGWAQSAGLGLYTTAGADVYINNVVIDTSTVEIANITYNQTYSYGAIVSKPNLADNGAYNPKTSNVYVFTSNVYMGYVADVTASGATINSFNGISGAYFASNDTAAYNDCVAISGKAILDSTYRYDNMASALTVGETFSGLTASASNLWALDANGELMFNGVALDSLEVTNFISNGTSDYAIVVPNTLNLNGTNALAYAVNDLHDYVSYATDGSVDLTVVKASNFDAQTYTKYISVGDTGLLTDDVTDVTSTLGDDGLFYFSKGDNIYFTGATTYGVANGIYDFLETYFGFDAITDDVVVYNDVTDVSFTTLYKVDTPDIAQRFANGVSALTRARYGARNGYMGYNVGGLYKAGSNYSSYEIPSMHNTLEYIPYAIHGAEHGAYWYATDANNVIYGGSSPKDICYTAHGNADEYQLMVNQFVSRLQQMFIQRDAIKSAQASGSAAYANASWNTLAITTEDNSIVCNCNSCQEAKALYGGYNSGALVKFINDVKAGIDAWLDGPIGSNYKVDNFKLMFFAYQGFIDAPVKVDETTGKYVPVHEDVVLADNVVVGLATSASSGLSPYYSINAPENEQGKKTVEKWASITDQINLWTYQTNFELYLYFSDTFELFNQEGYEFFDNNKVNSWVNQNSNAKQTGWAALKEYVAAKFMWDTNADLDTLYNNYFNAVYGEKAGVMRNLFNLQREYYQDALSAYKTANPESSVAGYHLKLNGYYDDNDLWSLVEGYRQAIASVEQGSFVYYQIIKEAVAPYYQLLTNHNRYGALANGKTSVTGSIKMEGEELANILALKQEFRTLVQAYEAKYGALYRAEGSADVSSDALYNSLGYMFKPSNVPTSMIIYSFDCTGSYAGSRVATNKTLTVGNHNIGWNYGYPDNLGNSNLDYRNITVEVLSGSDVAEITLGVDQDGNALKWNNSTYMNSEGKLPATGGAYARYQLGVLNCKKAGSAVLRLHYELDGLHYTYDLTITVK